MAEPPKISQQRLEFEAHFVKNAGMINTFQELWPNHGTTFEKVLPAVPQENRDAVGLLIQQLAADALTRGWNTRVGIFQKKENE